MSSFSKLRERFRDQTRDELCAHFRGLGIDAQLAPRGRAEEKITHGRGKSLGIIDVQDVLIRWVDVKRTKVGDASDERGGVITTWHIEYGVPDSRITAGFHKVKIGIKRIKGFPLFGKVVDSKWAGEDFGLGLIGRLSHDVSQNKTIMDTDGLEIGAYPGHSCWILTVSSEDVLAPSKQEWDGYQSIASHLLGRPLPPNT